MARMTCSPSLTLTAIFSCNPSVCLLLLLALRTLEARVIGHTSVVFWENTVIFLLDVHNVICHVPFAFFYMRCRKSLFILENRKGKRIAFIISVLAGIVAYYICKWLDRDE